MALIPPVNGAGFRAERQASMTTTTHWFKVFGLLATLTLILSACGQTPAAAPTAMPAVPTPAPQPTAVPAPTAAPAAEPTAAPAPEPTAAPAAEPTAAPAAATTTENPFRPTELFEVVDKLKAATQGKTPPA